MIGEITYSYMPDTWSQDGFLKLGGFTVVFLNYNKAAFIKRSVASALAQDFQLCEMFFMDDASTDGSGDTMERLVREYRGQHKVTVVRNTINQHITGQWNIVSKLASGNWFGMFCGDDVAHPDRVSLVAKRIAEHPTLKGLCTNVHNVASSVYSEKPVDRDLDDVVLQSGDCDLNALSQQHPPIIGATAWWHKSLFDKQLTSGPLDDLVLRWTLQLKYGNSQQPVWLYDGSVATVDYTLGAGITNEARTKDVRGKSAVELWIGRVKVNRHFAVVAEKTWLGILDYYRQHAAPPHLMRIVCHSLAYYRIVRGNTLTRLFHVSALFNSRLRAVWLKLFFQEFLGLRIAAFMSVKLLKRGLG